MWWSGACRDRSRYGRRHSTEATTRRETRRRAAAPPPSPAMRRCRWAAAVAPLPLLPRAYPPIHPKSTTATPQTPPPACPPPACPPACPPALRAEQVSRTPRPWAVEWDDQGRKLRRDKLLPSSTLIQFSQDATNKDGNLKRWSGRSADMFHR